MPDWFQDQLLVIVLLPFVVSVVFTPILRDVFRSYNVVDRPGQARRVHVHPIPRIGGIPIALAYGAALFFQWRQGSLGFNLWQLAPGASVVFLVGLLDDFFDLRPLVKLAGQVAAALLVFWSGLRIETLASPNGEGLPLWLNLPLTVFWLLLTTNALNLIDGLDGLCGGIGLLATLTLFGGALLQGNQALAYVTLPLVCALAGFLFYNLNPATVFLGDSGALLIGFLLGCYGMIWTQKTTTLFSLLVPLMALSIPLLDVAVAVLRRLLRRQPIFSADRGHIHHRLLDRGLTPKHAVLWLYLFAAMAAGLGLLLSTSRLQPFRNLVLAVLLAVFLFGLRELRYKEFHFFGQLLFGGEFQQQLQSKLWLDKLSAALAPASPETWWDILVAETREYGWSRMCWMGPQGVQEEVLSETEPRWTFLIPLEHHGSLQVDGGASSKVNLSEFATVVQASVGAKRAGERSEVR